MVQVLKDRKDGERSLQFSAKSLFWREILDEEWERGKRRLEQRGKGRESLAWKASRAWSPRSSFGATATLLLILLDIWGH